MQKQHCTAVPVSEHLFATTQHSKNMIHSRSALWGPKKFRLNCGAFNFILHSKNELPSPATKLMLTFSYAIWANFLWVSISKYTFVKNWRYILHPPNIGFHTKCSNHTKPRLLIQWWVNRPWLLRCMIYTYTSIQRGKRWIIDNAYLYIKEIKRPRFGPSVRSIW